MESSISLWWFENAYWVEQECYLDCLVDISQRNSDKGYLLVIQNGRLMIYRYEQIQALSIEQSFKVLGRVLMRNIPLNTYVW